MPPLGRGGVNLYTGAAQVIDAIGFVGLIYQVYVSDILLAYQCCARTDMSVWRVDSARA